MLFSTEQTRAPRASEINFASRYRMWALFSESSRVVKRKAGVQNSFSLWCMSRRARTLSPSPTYSRVGAEAASGSGPETM